jgi:hypothetical protein
MADKPLAREPGPDAFGMLGPLEVSRSGRFGAAGRPRKPAVLALLLV